MCVLERSRHLLLLLKHAHQSEPYSSQYILCKYYLGALVQVRLADLRHLDFHHCKFDVQICKLQNYFIKAFITCTRQRDQLYSWSRCLSFFIPIWLLIPFK